MLQRLGKEVTPEQQAKIQEELASLIARITPLSTTILKERYPSKAPLQFAAVLRAAAAQGNAWINNPDVHMRLTAHTVSQKIPNYLSRLRRDSQYATSFDMQETQRLTDELQAILQHSAHCAGLLLGLNIPNASTTIELLDFITRASARYIDDYNFIRPIYEKYCETMNHGGNRPFRQTQEETKRELEIFSTAYRVSLLAQWYYLLFAREDEKSPTNLERLVQTGLDIQNGAALDTPPVLPCYERSLLDYCTSQPLVSPHIPYGLTGIDTSSLKTAAERLTHSGALDISNARLPQVLSFQIDNTERLENDFGPIPGSHSTKAEREFQREERFETGTSDIATALYNAGVAKDVLWLKPHAKKTATADTTVAEVKKRAQDLEAFFVAAKVCVLRLAPYFQILTLEHQFSETRNTAEIWTCRTAVFQQFLSQGYTLLTKVSDLITLPKSEQDPVLAGIFLNPRAPILTQAWADASSGFFND